MFRSIAVLAATTLLAPFCAQAADTYPEPPDSILVPFPPGGIRQLARAVGARADREMGAARGHRKQAGRRRQYRDGNRRAGGARRLHRPDELSSGLSLNPHLYKNLPYDVEKDLAPVSQVATSQLVLVAHPDFKAKSMEDVIRLAKENPGAINYASVGIGTVHHVAMELVQRSTGIQLTHVPYKGNTPALVDLASGRVSIMLTSVPEARQNAIAGKVRMLAVTGSQRVKSLPDIPTIAESGIPGYDVGVWYGVVCPSQTPEAIVAKLSAAIAEGLKRQSVIDQLTPRELIPIGNTPAEFTQVIRTQSARWAKVIAEGHIQLE